METRLIQATAATIEEKWQNIESTLIEAAKETLEAEERKQQKLIQRRKREREKI